MVPPITDICVSTVFFTSLKMKVYLFVLQQTREQIENSGLHLIKKYFPTDLVEGGRVKVDLHKLKRFIIP